MKFFIVVLALAACSIQDDLVNIGFELLKADPTAHDFALIAVGFFNNLFYNDKDYKASKCLEGVNETIVEVEKIISTWSTDISYIIKTITELAFKLSPIINNCKTGYEEVASVFNRIVFIFEDFEAFSKKIMANLFGMIGMIGLEIQSAKAALEDGDFYRFGGDLGEIAYQVILKNC